MGSISFKITLTKEKERRKRNSEEEERRRREKNNDCTIRFYNGYFGEVFRGFWPKKKIVGRQKVHLAVTFSKIQPEDLICKMSNVCHLKLPKMAHFQRLAEFFGKI